MTLLVAIAIGVAVTSLALAACPPPATGSFAGPRRGALARRALLERWRRRQRDARAAAGATEVLQGTCAALRSGLPVALALRVALERSEPDVREPFDGALRAFDLNVALDEALGTAARAARDHRLVLSLEALALVAGEQLSATRAAAVVASVADRLSFDERLLAEVRARTSGVRSQIVLLALLVPALAVYLVLTMPGLAATLATPLGAHVLVPAAIGFELAGIVASRALVRKIGT